MLDKFKLVCIGATGIIFIASYFFVGVHYYRNGYETATKKYDEVLRSESEKNYQKIIETERNLTDKQNEIVSEYLKYIDDLEKQHEQDKIDMDNLRDAVTIDIDKLCHNNSNSHSATMPPKTTNQSKLKCYSESELQRKIKESLDITADCDRLAARFNSLLEWCKL
jgi:hypothetical protein